jgi:hypothetical protein
VKDKCEKLKFLNHCVFSKWEYVRLFLTGLCFFLFIFTGRINVDSLYSYLTAQNIINNGSISISKSYQNGFLSEKSMPHSLKHWDGGTNIGKGGKAYSKYGILWSVCMVPFYLLGTIVSKFISAPHEMIKLFVVSMLGPFLSAINIVLFYHLGKVLGIGRRALLYTLIFLTVGSINVYYARGPYVESLDCFFLLSIIILIMKLKDTENSNYLLAIGILIGFSFFSKIYNIILVVPVTLGLAYLYLIELRKNWKTVIYVSPRLFSPIAFFLALIFMFNFLRYGSILSTGYENDVKFISIIEGLGGFLFSPGKSIFIFNIGVVLAILGSINFYRQKKPAFFLIIFIVFTYLLFLSKFNIWNAGPWGTRYLFPSIFILHIIAALEIQRILKTNGLNIRKIGLSICLVMAILIHLPISFIDYEKWNLIGKRNKLFYRPDITYRLAYSPIKGSWSIFLSSIQSALTGESSTVGLPLKSNTRKIPQADESIRLSLSGYDEWNIWFVTLLRGSVTRYDESVTRLKISKVMKICTLAVSTGLMLISIVFGYSIIRNRPKINQFRV